MFRYLGIKLKVIENKYETNDRLAVTVVVAETNEHLFAYEGEIFAIFSTNVPEIALKPGEFILNHRIRFGLVYAMLKQGIIKLTGLTAKYGFCEQPILTLVKED